MILYLLLALSALIGLVALILLLAQSRKLEQLTQQLEEQQETIRQAMERDSRIETALQLQGQTMQEHLSALRQQQGTEALQNEQKLENLRRTLHYSLGQMQQENQRQLDAIRRTVDEKLQDTLEKKLNDSFALVSQRLEQVYKGLGEMQTLAVGVGDLKKVLSNVKRDLGRTAAGGYFRADLIAGTICPKCEHQAGQRGSGGIRRQTAGRRRPARLAAL